MEIKYSRHAKRRMALYGINEIDVSFVINKGEKQLLQDGRICFTFKLDKFQYPLKIVAIEGPDLILIVTAYPLKKMR